jgi:hypothetical protein
MWIEFVLPWFLTKQVDPKSDWLEMRWTTVLDIGHN